LQSYVINSGNIDRRDGAPEASAEERQTASASRSATAPSTRPFSRSRASSGHHYELDEFQIQAVTEGREALGAAFIKLRSNGRLYSGNGLSTDILGSCIRAYVNALNKIAYEEAHAQ
jgi:2-isopropylmalate synthase